MRREASFAILALAVGGGLLAPRTLSAAAPCSVAIVNYEGSGTEVLQFRGSPGKQVLRIDFQPGGGGTAWLDCNGNGTFTDAAAGDLNSYAISSGYDLDIQLKGNDTITLNGGWEGLVKVQLGAGTNSLGISSGTGLIANQLLSLDVVGGPGPDTVLVDFGAADLDNAKLQIHADLAAGNDSATFRLPSLNGLAGYDLDVSLGPGNNALTIDKLRPTGAGVVSLAIEGGPGVDTVTTTLAEAQNGNFTLHADLQGGNDVFTAHFRKNIGFSGGGFFNNGVTRLDVTGGPGNDILKVDTVFDGEFRSLANPGQLQIDLAGGQGNDVLDVRLGFDPELVSVAGGTFHYRLDGGAGNDSLHLSHYATPPNSGTHRNDIALNGGPGDDVLELSQQTSGLWIGGEAIVDGSFGTDRCSSGAAPVVNRNCEL